MSAGSESQAEGAAPSGITLLAAPEGEGIVGFLAGHSASREYQTSKIDISYSFGRPVDYVDAVAKFGEVQTQAEEQAEAKLTDTLARIDAQAQSARPPAATLTTTAPVPHPAEQQVPHPAEQEGVPAPTVHPSAAATLVVGESPKGNQVRYVPSSVLSSQAFEKAIRDQIFAVHGIDPDGFAVFDNRVTGKFQGLEDGGKSYGPAGVKARHDTPAARFDDKAGFFVDFNDDGTIRVAPNSAMKAYEKAAAAFSQ